MIDIRLGPYLTLGELGSGGMGTVYLAEVVDRAPGLEIGDRVALKIIHGRLMSQPGFFKRFLREGEVGRRIRHENVVATFDVDGTEVSGETVLFMATEYVQGQTLRALLEELGTVPEELCRHIALEIACGLEAIHGADVVHRDLKPENVLVTKDNVVKLMDLGVARVNEEGGKLSRTGTFVGSVMYAAPEQFVKTSEEIDGRSDLYALGLVLYEMTTGRHPFKGMKLATLMQAHMAERPRALDEIAPRTSRFFAEVVGTLLAKDPADRFASASELTRVLTEAEDGDWWRARVRAIPGGKARAPRRVAIARETALHGRDEEAARIRALFGEVRQGRGRVLLLVGEAGVGKTRLVDEVVAGLRAEGETLHFLFGGHPSTPGATEIRGIPLAFRDHLLEVGAEDALPRLLAEVAPLIPATTALLEGKSPPPGVAPLTRDSLRTVLLHGARALAEDAPTILLVDDLQFAPREARDLFSALAKVVSEFRMLLVGVARPEGMQDWMEDLVRSTPAIRMALPRLGPRDLNRLLVEAFRSESLAEALGWEIARKSDGNPLFVFEILEGLREAGLVKEQADGTWVQSGEIASVGLPSSMVDLIEGRLGDLEPEDKDLLDVACCCGASFDPLLVSDALGLAHLPVLKQLARIEQRQRLIRARGRRYVFDHNLVHEILYDRLAPLLREHYHAALARALEARLADGVPEGDAVVEVCRHSIRGGTGEKARPYLTRALDHLTASHRLEPALELADAALAVEGLLTGGDRADVLLRKAGRLDLLGRREEERAALDEALTLADETDDLALGARMRRRLGLNDLAAGRPEAARAWFLLALELAVRDGNRAEEGASLLLLGAALRDLGQISGALETYGRAIEINRETGDRRAEATACVRLGVLMCDVGRVGESARLADRALGIFEEIGDRLGEGSALGVAGDVALARGRHEESCLAHERAREIFRETGFRRGEGVAEGGLGEALMAAGRYAESFGRLDRSLEIAREVGDLQGELGARARIGWLCVRLGDVKGVRDALDALVTETTGDVLLLRGRLAELVGSLTEAAEHDRQALDAWREAGSPRGRSRAHLALGRLRLRQERKAEAIEHLLDVDTPGLRVRAAALRAFVTGEVAGAEGLLVAEGDRLGPEAAMEVRYHLWRAGAGAAHLAEAGRLQAELRRAAPAMHQSSMIETVPLHRAVTAALVATE